MTMQDEILSQLAGINYEELSRAEKNILDILRKNGITWHIDKDGEVQKGTKRRS
jgi:hypothetical protein